MTARPKDAPRDLEDAIAGLVEECTPGLEPERLRAVYARVERELRTPREPARPWLWLFSGAALSAAAALIVVLTMPERAVPPLPRQAPASGVQLLLTSGDVVVESAPDRGSAGRPSPTPRALRLGARAAVELVLDGRAHVALLGPAELRFDRGPRPQMTAGHAVFEVRHSDGPAFTVRAGDVEVRVLGTRFALAVGDNVFRGLTVSEGTVELVRPDGHGERVTAGKSSMREPQDAAAVEALAEELETGFAALDLDPTAPSGTLRLLSAPDGARARVDGERVGVTPLWLRLPVGPVEIALDKPGFDDWQQTVQISRDAELPVTGTLEQSRRKTSDARRLAELWREAQSALAAGACRRLDTAVQALVPRLASTADEARAWMLAGECYVRAGQRRRGLAIYERVVDRYADTASAELALFETAKLNEDLGRVRRSRVRFKQYLAAYPDGRLADAATLRLCESLLKSGALDDAKHCLEGYRGAFGRSPRATQAWQALAARYHSQGSCAAALPLYRDLLAQSAPDLDVEAVSYAVLLCLAATHDKGLAAAVQDYLRRFPQGEHRESIEGLAPK
ncbi:MAG: PEGA domain-containing protein [Deltaproteobacteria bacterium]|nr:PEGA domain-containing protein [Deltaproteobacteria bacterium]